MKAKLLLSIFLSFIFYLLSAQVPKGFNYQAIARSSDGKELINTPLDVKISILSDTNGFHASGTGNYIWEEQQSVTTNNLGLISIIVGNPVAVKVQGSAASFSNIDWTVSPLYIGTKIYYLGQWKIMGSAQIWTVPYSMASGTLSGPLKKLAVTGETSSMEDALFEVKNKDGQTVFAVYNEGVRVYVDDGNAKGAKGGFAIGGFGTTKSNPQDYFVVNADSIRGYIAPTSGKGAKGGFAIGGFDATKTASGEEYLRVTRDSSRIYVLNPSKGAKGGFAIGGFDPTKGGAKTPFTSLTAENYFIGYNSGSSITTGRYNSFLGYETGLNNSTGNNNVFIGYETGYSNTTGFSNTAVGADALFSNQTGVFNTAIGYLALNMNKTGSSSTAIGLGALQSNTTGDGNTSTGSQSLQTNSTGYYNTADGYLALFENNGSFNTATGNRTLLFNQTGSYNTGTGSYALFNNNGGNNTATGFEALYLNATGGNNTATGYMALYSTTGSNNTAVGYDAGYNSTGSGDVFIGYQAGYNETGSNKLYIANSGSNPPLIYGDFATGYIGLGTITPGYRLQVGNAGDGSQARANAWNLLSDIRYKTGFEYLNDALDKISALKGFYFYWNTGTDKSRQFGLSAQDVEKVLPEVVSRGNDGYLSVDYGKLVPLLIEGIKNQQQQIESYKSDIRTLQEKVDKIELQQKQIDDLKALVNALDANQQDKRINKTDF